MDNGKGRGDQWKRVMYEATLMGYYPYKVLIVMVGMYIY